MPVDAPHHRRIIGVVLAGGQSRRMGTDKAALNLHGETLLLRARRILLESGCTQVLLSGAARADWPDICVEDSIADAGPVAGIVATIRALQAWRLSSSASPAQVIFLPVDTPLLQPALLRTLLAAGRDADACVFDDSPLPLALNISAALLTKIEKFEQSLQAGESCSVHALLATLTSCRLPRGAVENHQLRNINTPQEWRWLTHELTH